MTIEEYEKTNEDFDIFLEHELDFVDSDNSKEAKENILYVIENNKHLDSEDILHCISVVVRSYYHGVIEWTH